MEEVFIYDCVRTPRGKAKSGGGLHEVMPHDLLASLLRSLPARSSFDPKVVSDLMVGCVTPVRDQGYNVAQAALLAADWPTGVGAAQVNRYCASGLESAHSAAARIAAGWDEVIVTGGVESMGRVPLGSDGGSLLQDPELILAAAHVPQGISADLIATARGYSREDVDAFALESQQRAAAAQKAGHFNRSIVEIVDENGLSYLAADEHPRPNTNADALAALNSAFTTIGNLGFDALALRRYPQYPKVNHVHTAGNSSGLVDGAALIVLGNRAAGESAGMQPRAKVRAFGLASSDATMMLLGMIPATERVLQRAGISFSDLDLMEVNEAFAAVPLAFIEHFDADPSRVNVNGGAIALGHPVGATGAMLVGTLLDELERRDQHIGLATLCAGGGQGIAIVIERV